MGIALLAAFAFALSYDALRQMAVALHIRGLLTYTFPLVIDGFIAIGVGALLMLRTAPLRSRVYVWALVGTATLTSIWANALHAVRLNQQARHTTGLRLDDLTVGAMSAIAPLALAGAVHLYIVIRRHPTTHAQQVDTTQRHTGPSRHNDSGKNNPQHVPDGGKPRRPEPTAPTPDNDVPEASDEHVPDDDDVAHGGPEVPAAPQAPRKPTGRKAGATTDHLLAIGRTAPPGRGGRISRRNIEAAVRGKGYSAGKDRLDQVTRILQAELDKAPVDAS